MGSSTPTTPAPPVPLRDVLQWEWVADPGSEPDWLIFKMAPGELGVHPTHGDDGETHSTTRHHSISLMCDDIGATIAELESRGAGFNGEVQDMGFGRRIMLVVPGADEVLLYQPKHPTAYDL